MRGQITIVAWDASNSKGVGQLSVQARSSVLDGSTKLTVEVSGISDILCLGGVTDACVCV